MVLIRHTRHTLGNTTRRFLFLFEVALRCAQYIGLLIGIWATVNDPLWLAGVYAIFTAILHVLANECFALRNFATQIANPDQ
jgi:hypothetical protein